MKDFRGPLPLNDHDFAEVRRNVHAQIERKRAAWPYALAAAAAMLALVIILLPLWRRAPSPAGSSPAIERPRAAAPTLVKPTPEPPKAEPVKVATEKPKRKPQAVVADNGAPPADTEVTMNIETADPNVRIIWISR